MSFLFDPELNLFLQSFQTKWLTIWLLIISALGSSIFLTAAAGFVLFRLSIKKGFLMLQLLVWSALVTNFLKSFLAFPRPTDVDPSVSMLEDQYPQWLLQIFPLRMNAGFPSGHVCSTTVFWGAMMILFRGKFLRIAGATFILLMPLSRMYLGRHFLGDVVGGLLLGGLILVAGKFFLIPAFRNLAEEGHRFSPFLSSSSFLFSVYLFALPVLIVLFVPLFEAGDAGKLLGVNAAFVFLLARGFPKEPQDSPTGFTRLALATFFYISIKLLFLMFATSAPLELWFSILAGAVPAFISIWATMEVSRRTGLHIE